jgi:hypothetical protein
VEPDRDKASGLLSTYLANVAKTFENDHIIVKRAWAAAVTFSDRDNRIMPGDFLERRKLSAKPEDKSTLAKCVEVREFMSRPRVQEWVDGKWEKGHILCNGEDFQYTVIREYVAKLLEPGAFGEPNSPTPSPEPPSSPEPRSTPEPQPSEQLPESQLPVPEPGSETVLKEAPATNPTNAVDKEGTTPPGTAPQLAANHVKAANAEAASKPRRKAGLAADATIKHEPVPNGGPRDSETRLPPSKIVYTTFRGGPVVREYPCGSSSSWEPPTTKYAVCIGTESQIFSKVDEAKASCDKAAERLAQKPRGEERNQNAALA